MGYCPNCGEKLVDSALFCSTCGKPTIMGVTPSSTPIRPSPKGSWLKVTVGIVVALFVALLVILLLFRASESGGLPWQSRSGTLELTLFNDDWLSSRSYSVHIDGKMETSGTLNALTTGHLTITVYWNGDSTHLCTIEVYSEGVRSATTSWLTDGMTASVALTI
jgi:hypothetical protein